jgi:hypothetical protein
VIFIEEYLCVFFYEITENSLRNDSAFCRYMGVLFAVGVLGVLH